MNEELVQKIDEQGKVLAQMSADIKQAKRYFMVSVWISIGLFVLPLLVAIVAIPMFISSYLGSFEGLL